MEREERKDLAKFLKDNGYTFIREISEFGHSGEDWDYQNFYCDSVVLAYCNEESVIMDVSYKRHSEEYGPDDEIVSYENFRIDRVAFLSHFGLKLVR